MATRTKSPKKKSKSKTPIDIKISGRAKKPKGQSPQPSVDTAVVVSEPPREVATPPLLPVKSMLKSFERLRQVLEPVEPEARPGEPRQESGSPQIWARRWPGEDLPALDGNVRLSRAFFDRHTLRVARDLVGAILVHHSAEGTCAGRIVETEAYVGPRDQGAHSRAGKPTERTQAMFGPRGHAYVFLVYGAHWCFNVVTGLDGAPQAVLIRALEPLVGVDLMRQHLSGNNRSAAKGGAIFGEGAADSFERAMPIESLLNRETVTEAEVAVKDARPEPREVSLCQGPGKLCRAMGIAGRHYGLDLVNSPELFLVPAGLRTTEQIARSARINIDYAGKWTGKPWRFYVAGHPAVSGPSKLRK